MAQTSINRKPLFITSFSYDLIVVVVVVVVVVVEVVIIVVICCLIIENENSCFSWPQGRLGESLVSELFVPTCS